MRLGVSCLLFDLGFRCGSAFPVCYLISVLGAARHWKGMFVKCAGFGFRCSSAFPVCYLISVLGAARRWKGMFVGRAGSGFRCGSAFPVCHLISVLGATRLEILMYSDGSWQILMDSWIPIDFDVMAPHGVSTGLEQKLLGILCWDNR